jgi:hypothetical protein
MSENKTRNGPRHYPFTHLSVYDESNPHAVGMVLDITNKGVRVKGIEARVDEIKRFIITAKRLFKLAPITIEVVCRWTEGGTDECSDSGFEIISISKADALELEELIHTLTFGPPPTESPEDAPKLRKEESP